MLFGTFYECDRQKIERNCKRMKLFRVVIADDDKLVLKDLKNMVDWKSLGFSIVHTATSGEDALKAIQKHHPDLLITDICMVGMNGLDLIEQANHEWSGMKVLIISSYDEFDYAKRAIANGVIDYLLKTEINTATLTQKLIYISDLLKDETVTKAAGYEEELFHFFASSDSVDYGRYPFLFPLRNQKYYFYIISPRYIFTRNTVLFKNYDPRDLWDMKELIKRQAKEYCIQPVVAVCEEYIILGIAPDISIGSKLQTLSYFEKQLMIRLRSSSILYVPFNLRKSMTLSEFRTYYKPLLPFVHYYSVFYSDTLINMESLQNLYYIKTERPFSFHSLIFDVAHQEHNIMLLKEYVMECCGNHDIYGLQSFYTSFCTYLEIASNNQMHLPFTLSASTPEYFMKWLFNTFQECTVLLERGLAYKYSATVDSAIAYMNRNYSNSDISVSDISDSAGLSVNRLGVLFKQETGKTINEYLGDIRIKKAVNLLEKTNMKIYEISEKCGYKSSQYFSQIFYQKTGKRPIDYRKAGNV